VRGSPSGNRMRQMPRYGSVTFAPKKATKRSSAHVLQIRRSRSQPSNPDFDHVRDWRKGALERCADS
jgi:hypothetical protein